jgi:hypothetical protein
MLFPLSFYSSSIEIDQFPVAMELFSKKGAFIVAPGVAIDHFSKDPNSFLIGAFKFVTILINEIDLSIKFCSF